MNDMINSGKTIVFKEEYESFPIFAKETIDPIYRAIVDEFDNIGTDGKMSLTVSGIVDSLEFNTTFEYTKADAYILKDVIVPFYEKKEDYEMCAKIMKIYSQLTA